MSCSTRRMPIPSRWTTPARMAPNCSVSPDVEARRRLVEQQEPEVAGQGPGQLHQAPLPGRQVADRPPGQVVDAAVVHRLVGRGAAGAGLGRGRAQAARPAPLAGRRAPPGPSSTFSRTVMVSNSSIRWNVRPRPKRARRAGEWRRRGAARRAMTVPAVGVLRPVQELNVVVLPAPFGPMRPVMTPPRAVERHVVDGHETAEADGEAFDHEVGRVDAGVEAVRVVMLIAPAPGRARAGRHPFGLRAVAGRALP